MSLHNSNFKIFFGFMEFNGLLVIINSLYKMLIEVRGLLKHLVRTQKLQHE